MDGAANRARVVPIATDKFTDDELREHRAHITKTKPQLPAQAGRLYAKLRKVYDEAIELAGAATQGAAIIEVFSGASTSPKAISARYGSSGGPT